MIWVFPSGSGVKNLPAMQEPQEMWVGFLDWEDPLEVGMVTHSSILAWRIPWMEEPGELLSIGSQRVGQSNCPELTDHGLVPLRCGSAREPKRPGEAHTAHPPASRREDSSREGPVSANAREERDTGLILGISLGGGHSIPLQYSCLENPMDRGAWWATVQSVAESDTTEVI